MIVGFYNYLCLVAISVVSSVSVGQEFQHLPSSEAIGRC